MTKLLHPRLSLSAVATFDWTFEQDLEFWSRAGLRCVGLSDRKFAAVGLERVMTELKRRNFAISCIVSGPFALLDPSAWEAERESMFRCIDVVHTLGGGVVYGPPGKGKFDSWDDNAARYAEAVAPCIAYGARRGVRVAFEPTLRPQISFVHNIRDSLDLVERSGADVVIDVGNCYAERDVREWIRRAGERIGLVQISDVAIGTMERPGAGTRGLPGSGELPLEEFLRAAMEAGYAGPFEIEYLGLGEVDQPAVLASLAQMSALLHSLGA
jgi:sugar phosphate isomerase/epimerase